MELKNPYFGGSNGTQQTMPGLALRLRFSVSAGRQAGMMHLVTGMQDDCTCAVPTTRKSVAGDGSALKKKYELDISNLSLCCHSKTMKPAVIDVP